MVGIESARVDQWLWSVRMTKTRGDAAAACRGGHVKVNGKAAKPATPVKVGDRVEAYLHDRERVLEVTTLIVKRVGATVAVDCFVDHSPPPPERRNSARTSNVIAVRAVRRSVIDASSTGSADAAERR